MTRSPTRLLQLADELLDLASWRPLRDRLPLLLLAGQALALAERRGGCHATVLSQRAWLRALGGRAAA